MKFEIMRTSTSSGKPCEEAYKGTLTNVDVRTVNDPSKLRCNDRETWYDKGSNHRLVNNMITRDLDESEAWLIDINSLEDLTSLNEKYGDIIISTSFIDRVTPSIEIYDGYRE